MTTNADRVQKAANVIESFVDTWTTGRTHDEAFTCYITERILWEYALSETDVEESITDRKGDRGIDA